MAFGVYVHIPYCIQRCTYCDFATYEQSKILPPQDYVQVLLAEIKQKHRYHTPQKLDTLYFGGGTPSLIPAEDIVAIIKGLEKFGYTTGPQTEITLEINPATIDKEKLRIYLDHGINRFSVGAQTFDNRLLKMVHREHNAQQTLETLDLLRSHNLNFSFDILFALPTQTFAGVENDLKIAMEQGASHISPYCLTVPDGHPLSKGRAPEDEQVEMFEMISAVLTRSGYQQYEISNFARPGQESRHNLLYWTDQEFWGLGLSSHSYSKSSPWGTRYWNVSSIGEYVRQIQQTPDQEFLSPHSHLPDSQFEVLAQHQALTDFCHTSLRLMRGLIVSELRAKFTPEVSDRVVGILHRLQDQGLAEKTTSDEGFRLTPEGIVVSNRVFQELTFLEGEIS